MRTLIVGVGALGGTIAARALAAGIPVSLATRDAQAAALLRSSGLRVSGIGGAAAVAPVEAAALEEYAGAEPFDLILLATKAREALEISPLLAHRLSPGGTLLPIQNGGVSAILCERLGADVVLGGLSNLGATMVAPGICEQRNAGHLLVGELAGGIGERAARVARFLDRAIATRATPNLRGAIWSKLLLNCSVTTLGAIAGQTMRQYIASAAGKEAFRRAYDEALAVALASGARPERMIVDPIPPRSPAPGVTGEDDSWIAAVIAAYGDVKPSMSQDFERGRPTEIDFINGFVARIGRDAGLAVPVNAEITATVHRIERGEIAPHPALLDTLLR